MSNQFHYQLPKLNLSLLKLYHLQQFEEYKKRLMRAGHEYIEEFTVEVAPGINMTRFIFIKKIYTENKTEKKVDKTG